MMLGRPAGDLHWERIEAGVYETQMYANGYLYRVVNENRNYGPPNEWWCYYKWAGKRGMSWKRVPGSYTTDTMKDAKERCRRHNMYPRDRYKFVERVTQKHVEDRTYLARYLGFLVFKETDRKGEVMRFRSHYMDPSQISGGPSLKEINDAKLKEQADQAMVELQKVLGEIGDIS